MTEYRVSKVVDSNEQYNKLNPKAKCSWRIGRAIRLPIWLIICAVAEFWAIIALDELYPWGAVLAVLPAILAVYKIIGLVIYPNIEYRQWGYYVTEDKVVIRHGIFFVTNTVIPIIRIQHITVKQGPINRKLGLHEVEISLASGSFSIEGLDKAVADDIAENLKSGLYTRLEAKQ